VNRPKPMSIEQRRANRARYGSLKAELKWAREVAALARQKNDLLARNLLKPEQALLISTYLAQLQQPTRRAKRWLRQQKRRRRIRQLGRASMACRRACARLRRSTSELTAKFIALDVAARAAEEPMRALASAMLRMPIGDTRETAGAAGEKETP
jgi:hypothetical protein